MSGQQAGPNDTAILGTVAGLSILTSVLVSEGAVKAGVLTAAIDGAIASLKQHPNYDSQQFRSVLEAMKMAVETAEREKASG